ncbi:MAG: glycerophosphodiester phosphodiesterase family protein [Propionibacterium acidifaciens]
MTRIWAHRGASRAAPENTVPAFTAAAALGADGVELDVQRTRDGQLVVCHDEQIDRTSTGHGWIRDMSLTELHRHDFSCGRADFAGTRIPTLVEVLTALDGTGLDANIELKNSVVPYPGMEAEVVETVERLGWGDRVIYSSFNHASMRLMARMGERVGLLYDEVLWKPTKYALDLGAAALHPSGKVMAIAPRTVRKAHRKGLEVNVWTLDRPEQVRAALALDVDAIITNTPDVALGVRDAAGRSSRPDKGID